MKATLKKKVSTGAGVIRWFRCHGKTRQLGVDIIPQDKKLLVTGHFLNDLPFSTGDCDQLVISRVTNHEQIGLSSPHSEIFCEKVTSGRQSYFVRDLNSTLGSYVNGNPLEANRKYELRNGYVVSFGRGQGFADFTFLLSSILEDTSMDLEDDLSAYVFQNHLIIDKISSMLSVPELKTLRNVAKCFDESVSPFLFASCVFRIPSFNSGSGTDSVMWTLLQDQEEDRYLDLLRIRYLSITLTKEEHEPGNWEKVVWFLKTFCGDVEHCTLALNSLEDSYDITKCLQAIRSTKLDQVTLCFGKSLNFYAVRRAGRGTVGLEPGALTPAIPESHTLSDIQFLTVRLNARNNGFAVSFLEWFLPSFPNLKKLSVFNNYSRFQESVGHLFSRGLIGIGFTFPYTHHSDRQPPGIPPHPDAYVPPERLPEDLNEGLKHLKMDYAASSASLNVALFASDVTKYSYTLVTLELYCPSVAFNLDLSQGETCFRSLQNLELWCENETRVLFPSYATTFPRLQKLSLFGDKKIHGEGDIRTIFRTSFFSNFILRSERSDVCDTLNTLDLSHWPFVPERDFETHVEHLKRIAVAFPNVVNTWTTAVRKGVLEDVRKYDENNGSPTPSPSTDWFPTLPSSGRVERSLDPTEVSRLRSNFPTHVAEVVPPNVIAVQAEISRRLKARKRRVSHYWTC